MFRVVLNTFNTYQKMIKLYAGHWESKQNRWKNLSLPQHLRKKKKPEANSSDRTAEMSMFPSPSTVNGIRERFYDCCEQDRCRIRFFYKSQHSSIVNPCSARSHFARWAIFDSDRNCCYQNLKQIPFSDVIQISNYSYKHLKKEKKKYA